MSRLSCFRLVTSSALFLLAACAEDAHRRSEQAAAARLTMPGMTREQVLACMGPAKKKASEGATEVWSYLSTDYKSGAGADSITPIKGYTNSSSSRSRHYCTVNVVMVNGVVQAVNYNGPSASDGFAGSGLGSVANEQCGYAVANCVGAGRDP